MKRTLMYAAVAALPFIFGSCKSVVHTATIAPVNNVVTVASVADLDVQERVTFRYKISREERKAGLQNCKETAVAAMLRKYGNADIIVGAEYYYDSNLNFMEVSGRPATYKNFRTPEYLPVEVR